MVIDRSSQFDHRYLSCRLKGPVAFVEIRSIHKLRNTVVAGPRTPVDVSEHMHFGPLLLHSFEESFAAQMIPICRCLVKDAMGLTMGDQYIKSVRNAVPVLVRCFATGIHKCPVKKFWGIRRTPKGESTDRNSAIFQVNSV